MASPKTLLRFCLCASVLSISVTLWLLSLLMAREEVGGLGLSSQPRGLGEMVINQRGQREILDLGRGELDYQSGYKRV